ncbi:hypothetical protein EVAR_50078_1 [Eumeta japonica]|uniref:Uncharacterized protein n=1 Tax=Eumeta variegata TaxID=151549 RepID=A0A4C1ZTX0_EUMVA|nr:hypothetical protein EVAR_50078_1 [Eumeta japonica]
MRVKPLLRKLVNALVTTTADRPQLKVQYNARNSAAVKLVTKTSQWRKTGKRGRRRKNRGALNLRIESFAGNSQRQSFVRCTFLQMALQPTVNRRRGRE